MTIQVTFTVTATIDAEDIEQIKDIADDINSDMETALFDYQECNKEKLTEFDVTTEEIDESDEA